MSFTVNNDDSKVYTNSGYLSGGSSLVDHFDDDRNVWCVVTAKNGDSSTQSTITSIDVQPVYE